jgi:outer membrane protein assembly factor BamB
MGFGFRICLLLMMTSLAAHAADWPQWRGPARDARSAETGLLRRWPAGGPPAVWIVDGIGTGFSSVVTAGGTVFVTGAVDGQGRLSAFTPAGRLLWSVAYGLEWGGGWGGPRTTPTVDGDRVYLYSAFGMLLCFDARTGSTRWSLDTRTAYKANPVNHGLCESVAIAGNYAICTPGGPEVSVLAVDKLTGAPAWTASVPKEIPAYSTTLVFTRGKRTVIAAILSGSLIGLDAADGTLLWRHVYDEKAGSWPCAIPVYANGILFAHVGKGCTAFRVSDDGGSIAPLWEQPKMPAHHGGVVVVDGYLYGTPNVSGLTCLDFTTGAVQWQAPRAHSGDISAMGAITAADGMLYLSLASGHFRLVKANPKQYELVGEFTLPAGTTEAWAHPAISDARLYYRRGPALMAFAIAAKGKAPGPTTRSQLIFPRWDAAGAITRPLPQWATGVAAPKVKAAPAIDGALDDLCWQTAPAAVFTHPDNVDPRLQAPVTVQLCQDAGHLYVACRRAATTRNGTPVPIAARQTGESAYLGDDSVEVFLSDEKRVDGVHLGLGSGGAWFSAFRHLEQLVGSDYKWAGRADWAHAAQKTETTWTGELAIPFDTLRKAGLDPKSLAVNLLVRTPGVGSHQRMLRSPGGQGFGWCKEFSALVDTPHTAAGTRFTARVRLAAPREGAEKIDLLVNGARVLTGCDTRTGNRWVEVPNLRGAEGSVTFAVEPAAAAAQVEIIELQFTP